MTCDDLIGKPYRKGGRGPEAYDCAGLVVELCRRRNIRFSIPVTPESEASGMLSMQRILRARWRDVEVPYAGCLVFIRPRHVGVMLDRKCFVHASETAGQVCIERIDAVMYRSRLGGFYEYEGAR